MSVNSIVKVVLRNQFIILCGMLTTCVGVFLITTAFIKPSNHDLFVKRANLVIRDVGHHVLLQAGDSTSRVLPVKELSPGVFLLSFENEFDFIPDSLIAITQRLLTKAGFQDYTVTVHACSKPAIVYGFQINTFAENSIKPCKGRIQPKDCYSIQIAFANFNEPTNNYASASLILGSFIFFVSVVLIAKRFGKNTIDLSKNASEPSPVSHSNPAGVTLGKFTFDLHQQKLVCGSEEIILTDKECKILELLNKNFGQLTTREDLIQEIWANEGVITGRSLDMFISKLRKKLSADPSLHITNVHGRGYKLEVI